MIRPAKPTDSPVQVPLSELTVTLTQGATVLPGVTDQLGHFSITATAGPGTVSGKLAGPNIVVHNRESGVDATHGAAVTVPGTHDWGWSADDPSPQDVETNAFYHATKIRNWFLRGSPFDVDIGPIVVNVRFGLLGSASGDSWIRLGHDPASSVDDALCADILYHEYTHRVVRHVYTGTTSPADPDIRHEYGAMEEAFADYFGAAVTGDPAHGAVGCLGGVRNISTPDARYSSLWTDKWVSSMILSGAMWDVRVALANNDLADGLAFRAIKQAPYTMHEFLRALLEEDDGANSDLSDGTPNIDAICGSFSDRHGIYDRYCAGHTGVPVAEITSPRPRDMTRISGGLVAITGSAVASRGTVLQSFKLEHAGANGAWSTTGVTLTGGGTTPVNDDVLGMLDVTGLAEGLHQLRLTVEVSSGQKATALTVMVVDRNLASGWPRTTTEAFYGSPIAADLDPSYPGLEVIATGGLRSGVVPQAAVLAWHADGTPVPGWPPHPAVPAYTHSFDVYSFTKNFATRSGPAVADLDGDGSSEVVVAGISSVNVFNADGKPRMGWPKSFSYVNPIAATPALVDLDLDGALEVVIGSGNRVYAWRHDGNLLLPNWLGGVGSAVLTSAAVDDIQGDDHPEMIVGTAGGQVYVLRWNGTVLTGWPQATTDSVSAAPALGDLNGDRDLEIVVASQDRKVYAWHSDGTTVSGWPVTVSQPLRSPTSVAISDVDGGGDAEVVAISQDHRTNVWKANGTPLAGWPVATTERFGQPIAPAISDIDGDGDTELVLGEGSSWLGGLPGWGLNLLIGNVYGFDHSGTPLVGWPKVVPGSASAATMADLVWDGDAEVVAGSAGMVTYGSVFVWKAPGGMPTSPRGWPSSRHDVLRTGSYGPVRPRRCGPPGPTGNVWTVRAPMPSTRRTLGIGVVDGILYAIGGLNTSKVAVGTVEAYNPATNTWTTRATMPTARAGLGVGVVNGVIYAIGGVTGVGVGSHVGTVEAYDPATNTWTTKSSMPTPRSQLAVGVSNGILFAIGGSTSTKVFSTVEAYDPMLDAWTTRPLMAAPRYQLAAGVPNRIIYVIGGLDGSNRTVATNQAYDPATNTWTTLSAMPTGRPNLSIGVIDCALYAIDGGFSRRNEAYRP
jgi:hypothetical protein